MKSLEKGTSKKLHQFSLFLWLLPIIFLFTGCLGIAISPLNNNSSVNRNEESFAEFLDVPYPASMGLDRKEIFTYSRKDVLSGVIAVTGRMNIDEIGEFYDQHLPSHGWIPRAEAQAPKKLVSIWSKDRRVLTIIAQPVTLSIGQDSRIELWVAPPHTNADLGHRIIYQSSTEPSEKFSTTPVRTKKSGGIVEEDL